MAFFELRQYKVQPGRMDDWVSFMEEVIIPFQTAQGMVITGSYRDEEDDNAYVWMRRFDSDEACKALYEKVYKSDTWRNEIAPKVKEMMDSVVSVTRMLPTAKSVAQ